MNQPVLVFFLLYISINLKKKNQTKQCCKTMKKITLQSNDKKKKST